MDVWIWMYYGRIIFQLSSRIYLWWNSAFYCLAIKIYQQKIRRLSIQARYMHADVTHSVRNLNKNLPKPKRKNHETKNVRICEVSDFNLKFT